MIYERYNLFLLAGVWLRRSLGVPLLLEVNAPLAWERAAHGRLSLRRLAGWSELFGFRDLAARGSLEQRYLRWSSGRALVQAVVLAALAGVIVCAAYRRIRLLHNHLAAWPGPKIPRS